MAEKNTASEVDSRKRLREDSASDEEHESKLPRLESDVSSEPTLMSEKILDILDDNVAGEPDAAVQGLESVIKSFEEEIVSAPQPDLWYLLEASDDELGLPPSFGSSGDEQSGGAGESTAGEDGYAALGGFEVDMEGYGGLGLGGCGDLASDFNSSDGDWLMFDGLFDNGYAEAGTERVGLPDPLSL